MQSLGMRTSSISYPPSPVQNCQPTKRPRPSREPHHDPNQTLSQSLEVVVLTYLPVWQTAAHYFLDQMTCGGCGAGVDDDDDYREQDQQQEERQDISRRHGSSSHGHRIPRCDSNSTRSTAIGSWAALPTVDSLSFDHEDYVFDPSVLQTKRKNYRQSLERF